MPLICIDGTTVSITVDGPQKIAKTSDTVATSTMNTMKIDGKSILLEADLADWLSGYQTAYDHSSYSGGKAQGDAITGISNLTTKPKPCGAAIRTKGKASTRSHSKTKSTTKRSTSTRKKITKPMYSTTALPTLATINTDKSTTIDSHS